MHPILATLLLVFGALLIAGCEMSGLSQGTTAPAPSPYETVSPPILQTSAPGSAVANAAPSSASPTSNQPPRPVRAHLVDHTVAAGESLWSLSRKYETSIQEIRDANQLTGDMIRAGDVLKIPTSTPDSSFSAAPTQQPAPPTYPGPVTTAPSASWTVTPPATPPTSSGGSAPQYRIPEPVILPPPGNF
jgi:LysM repeat protein